jgi:hypothetical protein
MTGPPQQLLRRPVVTYLAVVFVLFPFLFVSGLAMSPGVTSAFPIPVNVLGGQQSARTLHAIDLRRRLVLYRSMDRRIAVTDPEVGGCKPPGEVGGLLSL